MPTELGPLFPFTEPIAAADTHLVTPRWRSWLRDLRQDVARTAVAIPTTPIVAGSTSVAVTSMDGGNQPAGLFAISWYLAIVTAAGGSSVQVTIAWVDGVARSYPAVALSGAVASNAQVNERILIYSTAASPITYAITYAGAGMTYTFRPVLQSVSTS